MSFSDVCALIDAQLDADSRFTHAEHVASPDESMWALGREVVTIRPQGTTGITLTYTSDERVIHTRTFAASTMSVDRIVRTATEHLTGYVDARSR
jgi:hypothetical protein